MLEKLQYPIGKFSLPKEITKKNIIEWIETIEEFPTKLDRLTKKLSDNQLDTPYRENGWTIRQVVHHCADSHQNSYTRFKWALTEDKPVIKAYYEDKWGALFDSTSAPIQLSINVLKALHTKWVYFLKGLNSNDLEREFIHPDGNEAVSLATNIAIYAWHCDHHFAHIYNLLEKNNWLD